MFKKATWYVLILCIILGVTACNKNVQPSNSNASRGDSEVATPTILHITPTTLPETLPTSTPVVPSTPVPRDTAVLPDAEVIYELADKINSGKYDEARSLLSPEIGLSNLESIEKMIPVEVIDLTSYKQDDMGNPYAVVRYYNDKTRFYSFKVYYAEMDLQVKNPDSEGKDIVNGTNYIKFIFVKDSETSPWKIAVMGMGDKDWMDRNYFKSVT